MEKMLQSLLRLHCQTFLEKTYLKNSALNPRIVLQHGCAPAPSCTILLQAWGEWLDLSLSSALKQIPPQILQTTIFFFPSKNGFFLPTSDFFYIRKKIVFLLPTALSLTLGMPNAGKQWGPAGHPSAAS